MCLWQIRQPCPQEMPVESKRQGIESSISRSPGNKSAKTWPPAIFLSNGHGTDSPHSLLSTSYLSTTVTISHFFVRWLRDRLATQLIIKRLPSSYWSHRPFYRPMDTGQLYYITDCQEVTFQQLWPSAIFSSDGHSKHRHSKKKGDRSLWFRHPSAVGMRRLERPTPTSRT